VKQQSIAIVGVEWDVVDLIDSMPYLRLAGFIDPSPHTRSIPHLGSDDAWDDIQIRTPHMKVVLALDDPAIRARLFVHYGQEALMTLLSPDAHISHRSTIGLGSIIQRGAAIMPYATLGTACKVNVNAAIHHEAAVGPFCTIAPGAQILGRVEIGEGAYVGAGAIIRQRCRIGAGAIIGAGAVVVSDIPPRVTVVGVPAKELHARRVC
jgi:sugar O-acyltransferase (sialic acid O-acetyltransferase NeuD family)